VAARIGTDVTAYLETADPAGQVRAVLSYQDGEPVLERYSGATADDYWDTRSVTKSVMSALIGIAIEQGHIDSVDATLGELLPSYGDDMTDDVAAITLRQVLTHTANFSASPQPDAGLRFWEASDWVRAILADRAQAGPGDGSFAYSNAGAHVLSAVLVESTGRPVLEYGRENLFDPLGVPTHPALETPSAGPGATLDDAWDEYYASDFAWPRDPQGYHWGDGGIRLRPKDLARIGQLYLDDGAWQGNQVVPASWVEESTASHVGTPVGNQGYGYQWWVADVDGSPGFLAQGYGGQLIAVVPERDLVVVLASAFDERDALRLNTRVGDGEALELVRAAIAPRFG
jgi:CubicO group peptidase (beta-lactamase class C family)